MQRVIINRNTVKKESVQEYISDIIGRNSYNVELFIGELGIDAFNVTVEKLENASWWEIVDDGSRDTLALKRDGKIITDQDEINKIEDEEAAAIESRCSK